MEKEMIRTTLEIYFGFNLFWAAYILGENLGFSNTGKEKAGDIIYFFINLLIGVWLLIYSYVADGIKWVASYFQLKFYIKHLFGGNRNLKHEDLKRMNNNTALYKSTNSLRHRIWRHCTRLANKRNNYIHEANQ